MPHETEFPAESESAVLSDDRQRTVDELGRLAGAALRSPAPEHGASAIRRQARNQRTVRAGAAVAGVLVVVAVGVAVLVRGDESRKPGKETPDNTVVAPELHDVNRKEAAPLARRALLTADDIGAPWTDDQFWSNTEFPDQFALTIAAMPECAPLKSFGVFPPTTKSAGAFQHGNLGIQNVQVFATPEDASRAMDVIEGPGFAPCWFNFWDHETSFDTKGTTISTTEAWEAPPATAHGDREIVFGQHSTYVNGAASGFPPEQFNVLIYIQVGRAITFVNPVYDTTLSDPLSNVDDFASAAATALTTVFGS